MPSRSPFRARPIVITASIVTVFGLLAAGVATAVLPAPVPGRNEPALALPLPGSRDRIEYDSVERTVTIQADGTRSVRDLAEREVILYEGVGVEVDAFGRQHETVRVSRMSFDLLANGGSSNEVASQRASVEHYRIGARDMLRYDAMRRDSAPYIPLAQGERDVLVAYYGPEFDGNAWPFDSSVWLYALLQGRELRVGDDLSAEYQATQESLCAERLHSVTTSYGDVMTSCTVTGRLWVAGRALLDGEEVWEVRAQKHDSETYLLAGTSVLEDHDWINRTLWMGPRAPYPLRVDVQWATHQILDGERTIDAGDGNSTLVELERQGSPVAWGPTLARLAPPADAPSFPSSPYPRGGDGWAGFPPEEAVDAIESDPTLVAFRLWRAQNPGARVVGLAFLPAAGLANARTEWTVIYAAPQGESVMRIASAEGPPGVVSNRVLEPQGVHVPVGKRFDPAWMPQAFAPIAAADDFWREVDPTWHSQGANYVRWGYTCCFDDSFLPELRLNTISYGRYEPLTASAPNIEYSIVDLDATTGWGHSGVRSILRPSYEGLLPQAPAIASAAEPLPPADRASLGPVAALAGGLCVLALVAYFLEIIRITLTNGALALFSRLKKGSLLDNAIRDALMRLIRDRPGITPPQLQKETGAGWSTVVYHLGVLEKNGFVASLIDGRHKRFFAAGAFDHSTLAARAVLANARTSDVYDLVRSAGMLGRTDVARELRITPAGAYWHLKRLERAGYVRKEGRGGAVVYRSTEAVVVAARADA